MPTKHKIVDGPPFKYFFFGSHAVAGSNSLVQFTLGNLRIKKEDDRHSFHVVMIGKSLKECRDEDAQLFIARSHGGSIIPGGFLKPCWLVGEYNPRTRKGACTRYEEDEFFQDPITKELFSGR